MHAGNFDFPSSVELPEEAKQMIKKLVVADPTQRLGTETSDDIKNHAFFSDFLKMKFSDLENKKVTLQSDECCMQLRDCGIGAATLEATEC